MTAEEIALLTQFRTDQDILWAGVSIVKQALDKTGTSGGTVFLDRPVLIPLPEVKSMFPIAEATALANYLQSAEGVGINWMLKGLENPDINHPTFGQLLGYLATVAGCISMETVLSILNLGKRLKTRSEELFGRELTTAEIEEGIANAQ
jgi:hypothetical protein